MPSDSPLAVDGLDVNQVKDGLIVYDPARDRVHYLNNTAAAIFTLCDGDHDADAIAATVAELFGADAPTRDEIDECLDQLVSEGVLKSGT